MGLYDALFVMQDAETKTLWHHITGEALYGPKVGRTLGPVGNLLQINVEQALAMNPATEIAISDRVYFAGGQRFGTATGLGPGARPAASQSMPPRRERPRSAEGRPRINADAKLMGQFVPTLGEEDQRRPRMDVGLGVWTGTVRRYYPMDRIREHDSAFIDELDGSSMLVFIDPATFTPAAIYADATGATIEGREVHLDDGSVYRSGVLYDRDGAGQAPERPPQLFTRWYGFALTFPGPEVFGE